MKISKLAFQILFFALLALMPAQGEVIKRTVLSGVTTGTSATFALNGYETVGLQVAWSSGVSAGEVTLETAPTANYAGTWTPALVLSAPAAVPATTADAVDICAVYGRVRVTTNIVGGTVDAYVYGQNGK